MSKNGSTTYYNSSFYNSFSEFGGAVGDFYGIATIASSHFVDNTAYNGGGALVGAYTSVTCSDTEFTNNGHSTGGGIYSVNSNMHFSSVTFSNNTSNFSGGAILGLDSSISMNNVVIRNNTAPDGSGVSLWLSDVIFENMFLEHGNCVNTGFCGEIVLTGTRIQLKKHVIFSKSNDNTCDLFNSLYDVDDSEWRSSCVNFPSSPPPQHYAKQQATNCITNDKELMEAIQRCNGKWNTDLPCFFDVCQARIDITTATDPLDTNHAGIEVFDSNIALNCVLPTQRCIFDGSDISRIFHGFHTNITLQNFIFLNGYANDGGGAIKMVDNSIVMLYNCSFYNNGASSGSAIFVNHTKFTIQGIESTILNNAGVGIPLEIYSIQLKMTDTIISANNNSTIRAGILLFDSKIEVERVKYVKLEGSVFGNTNDLLNFSDCDILVTSYPDDKLRNALCLNFENSNITMPMTDVPTDYPKTSPPYCASPISTSPPTTSPPTISPSRPHTCFSGYNTVEVKNKGHLRMDELQVGDYVMSGEGKFSLVYGFGHLDRDREELFHQIHYARFINDQSIDVSSMSILEISSNHLIFVNKNNHLLSIPARDVIVGDVLSNNRTVVQINTVVRQGLFAPLTMTGDIFVSGILASNYVDILN